MRREPAAPVTVELPALHAVGAVSAIAAAADTARVVMINEQHHIASDRLLTLQLLRVLRAKGYRYFAAETFDSRDTGLMRRGYALQGVTGVYSDDPVFGEVIRESIRLGYTLVPYEMTATQERSGVGVDRQRWRDSIEAQNLVGRIFSQDPEAKVLVHAGIGHIFETDTPEWRSMALYFRSLTGINPVTVDQTRFGERSSPAHESPILRAAIDAGLVRDGPVILFDRGAHPYPVDSAQTDFHVMRPRTTYTHDRPDWMAMNGRRVATDVATPECAEHTCFVDAHVVAEPDSAVVLDRVDTTNARSVRLFLPSAQPTRVRIMDANGALLRTVIIRRLP